MPRTEPRKKAHDPSLRPTALKAAGLAGLALLCLFLCAACSSSSVQIYTDHYDTAENLARFRESELFAMAEGFRVSAQTTSPAIHGRDPAADRYVISRPEHCTTPAEPFLAVMYRQNVDRQAEWSVFAGSEKEMDLTRVRTLVLCIVTESSATYQEVGSGAGRTYTGTTEHGRILYLDAKSGTFIQESEIKGRELPQHTSDPPHYKLSRSEFTDRIRMTLTLPFTLSEDGEITGGKLGENLNTYLFPDSVRKISKLELDPEISSLGLPASIEEIAPGIIPHQNQTKGRNYGRPEAIVLTVIPGTYGERFAREGGYVYKRPGDSQQYLWIAGCECTFDYNYRYAEFFPNTPDGDLADLMGSGYLLFVEEGSPAAAYAQAHQYLYSYSDKWERRCCIDGVEWILYSSGSSVLSLPDGITADEDTLARIKKTKPSALICANPAVRDALAESGVEYWTGSVEAAEREWTDGQGLAWRIAYSFRDQKLLAVHIPRDYVQDRSALSVRELCRYIGFNEGSHPLCYVQPGSWAAEHTGTWIGEGTDVLHMSYDGRDSNAFYISEYTCGVITRVIDPYFTAHDQDEPKRMLSEHGIQALYTESPLGYSPVEPFALTRDPGKMYYAAPDRYEWHLSNEKTLEGVHTLKISGSMPDADDRAWVLHRAKQDEPFLLEVEEGSAAEAFARENGIPCETWDRQKTPFVE